ncbi:MAG: MaoC family dehydratase N-terminal domain-containing protein [Porticoccaceae bacterium]|nr:MaoC family dehydratase N-terminal domain-containing protein [Porticoccaceae bacterium]
MTTTMKQLGAGFYWQDLTVGDQYRSWGRTMLEADICTFVNLTGLHEVVFTDREFLQQKSVIKRPFAPGALVYGFAEGLLLPTMQGTGMAFLNMELDMKRPCFAGDTIHVELEVVEVRQTREGNRGLVRTFNKVVNQDGEIVLTYNPLRMLKGREE